jgi:hypothetical protein
MKVKSFLFLLILTCLTTNVSSQNINFFALGKKLFESCKYDDALIQFLAANLDEPKNDSINLFIKHSIQCKNLTTKADSLFLHKYYEEALSFYIKIDSINKHDIHAAGIIKEISNKLNCFNNNVETGEKYFEEGNYSSAIDYYLLSKECELNKDTIRLAILLKNARYCLNKTLKADSLFAFKRYEDAFNTYQNVLSINTKDDHCIMQNLEIKNRINTDFLSVSYSYQNYCPYGFSLSFIKKWGLKTDIRIDKRSNEFQYSAIVACARSFYKYGNLNIIATLGTGYGKYAFYWFEKGESAHNKSYPNGLQFEGSFMLVFLKYFNFNLGCILPTFNLGYTNVTLGFGLNFYFKHSSGE